jgi:glutaredoxin 2
MSTHDGESIKQLQAQWKKKKADLETNFQTQLTTMDTTVKTVLERLDSLETRLDTKLDEMELKLTGTVPMRKIVQRKQTLPFVCFSALTLVSGSRYA